MSKIYRIGTRKSELAMWQAQYVEWLMREQWPEEKFEIVALSVKGDDSDLRISDSGGKDLYCKDLEKALIAGEVDLCVHSLKDLPVTLPEECNLAAVIERGEVRDVVITRDKKVLHELPEGSKIGTSSLRRRAQLRAQGVSLEIVDIRGNVDTRIKKLHEGEVDALILAAAGVLRLGRENEISEYLEPYTFVPAPGQGAIAIECRTQDEDLRFKLRTLHHDESGQAIEAERSFLKRLGGSCVLPLGAWCQIEQFQMRLRAFLADVQAETVMMESAVGPVGHAQELGEKLADRFLSQGARRVLEKVST
ncbi:MAG: hydroxymethylbilane synthase [Bradymonadales bacterium]|nr:MAG: hydroxymethylbilane synthase [Bradymonadales bacterium]